MKIKSIIITILVICIILIGIGYSKVIQDFTGIGNTQIGNIICETSIEVADAIIPEIDPYLNINIMNYDLEDNISDVSYSYIISIEDIEGGSLPDYICKNSFGEEVANTQSGIYSITGVLGHTTKQNEIYTIQFLNSGDLNITKSIAVKTTAVQITD